MHLNLALSILPTGGVCEGRCALSERRTKKAKSSFLNMLVVRVAYVLPTHAHVLQLSYSFFLLCHHKRRKGLVRFILAWNKESQILSTYTRSLHGCSSRFVIVQSTARIPSLYSVGRYRLHLGSEHQPGPLEGEEEENNK